MRLLALSGWPGGDAVDRFVPSVVLIHDEIATDFSYLLNYELLLRLQYLLSS